MFTWICPKCGREVPPSYTDCPDCAKTGPAAEQVAQPSAAAPPARPMQAPPAAPQYAAPAPPAYQLPPPGRGLPTWALTLLFAFAFLGLGSGVYWLIGASKGSGAKPAAAVESPAAKPGAKTIPYQKYIEVSGVRFVEGGRKSKNIEVRFIITNHSGADIPGIAGNVTIWGRTRNAEEDAAGTFSFKTDLKGFESKDLTVPLTTKKEMIELPDWQNVSTDVQITSPE
jgi:hypothetical protein